MFKNIFYAVVICSGTTACQAEQQQVAELSETHHPDTTTAAAADTGKADESLFALGPGYAGPVKKGMLISDLRQQLPQQYQLTDTVLQQEGQAYEAFLLKTAGAGAGLLLEQQCEPDCQVWRIRVSSPAYKTAAGLGVGASFGEIQKHYKINYVVRSEAGLVAVAEQHRLSFVLDAAALPSQQLANPTPAAIPENTRVKQIFVY